jgi:hypothetical protein
MEMPEEARSVFWFIFTVAVLVVIGWKFAVSTVLLTYVT